jgi:hypothetical protein
MTKNEEGLRPEVEAFTMRCIVSPREPVSILPGLSAIDNAYDATRRAFWRDASARSSAMRASASAEDAGSRMALAWAASRPSSPTRSMGG